MSSTGQHVRIVLILVHGTFAPSAPWTQDGSALRSVLAARIPDAQFETFEWSGQNSHHERLAAGQALGKLVVELCSGHSDTKCFILAHSHGGNVALYALKDPRVAERVTGVVSIATPFLHFRPRFVPRAVAPLVAMGYVAVVWYGVMIAISLAGGWAREFWLGIGALLFPAAYVVFGQATLPANLYRRLRVSIARRQNQVVRRAPWPVTRCSLLNLQVSFDEARFYLSILGTLAQAAITPLPALVLLGPTLGGAGLVIVGLVLMPALGFASMVGMVLRGHRFGFGPEAFLDHLVADIRVSTTPTSNVTRIQQLDPSHIPFAPQRFGFEHMLPVANRHWKLLPDAGEATTKLNVQTLKLAGVKGRSRLPGLRHSVLYDSDDIGKTISDWIVARLVTEQSQRLTPSGADAAGVGLT
jgi:hypothetical protein